jgi:hypothetical protein
MGAAGQHAAACHGGSKLANPDYLIEVVVTAALN